MDLQQDPDEFSYFLMTASRDFKNARDNLLERIEHWQKLSEMKYDKNLVVELLPDQKGFSGSILGKSFQICISPIAHDQTGGIEAVLTVPALNGGSVEIDRFFVNRDGDVVERLSPNRGAPNDRMSINTLTGVLRAVLDAPTRIDAGSLSQS